jgi:hypothetical protein
LPLALRAVRQVAPSTPPRPARPRAARTQGERALKWGRASGRRRNGATQAEACISWAATLATSAVGDRDGPASSQEVAGPQRIGGVEQELAEAGEVGGAGDLGQDRRSSFPPSSGQAWQPRPFARTLGGVQARPDHPVQQAVLGRDPALAPSPTPQVRAESARALCTGCGGPLVGRQRVGCSSRCRAVVSRQRKAEARRERDAEIRALLEAALEKLREDP